jgi:hypothetical protein
MCVCKDVMTATRGSEKNYCLWLCRSKRLFVYSFSDEGNLTGNLIAVLDVITSFYVILQHKRIKILKSIILIMKRYVNKK